jgi:hypothetical protein
MQTMNLPVVNGITPVLIIVGGDRAGVRFLEFLASAIRNPHTRRVRARRGGFSENPYRAVFPVPFSR